VADLRKREHGFIIGSQLRHWLMDWSGGAGKKGPIKENDIFELRNQTGTQNREDRSHTHVRNEISRKSRFTTAGIFGTGGRIAPPPSEVHRSREVLAAEYRRGNSVSCANKREVTASNPEGEVNHVASEQMSPIRT